MAALSIARTNDMRTNSTFPRDNLAVVAVRRRCWSDSDWASLHLTVQGARRPPDSAFLLRFQHPGSPRGVRARARDGYGATSFPFPLLTHPITRSGRISVTARGDSEKGASESPQEGRRAEAW